MREWEGRRASFERALVEGQKFSNQVRLKRLLPGEDTRTDSMIYPLHNGVEEIPLAPGTTVYKNSLGGTVICFAGSSRAQFTCLETFSFLNETRKAQLIRLLRETGNLPLYYVGDKEVFCKTGVLPDGERLCSRINIGLDPMDEIVLDTETPVTSTEMLTEKGERVPVAFRCENGRSTLEKALYTLEPAVLLLR